MSFACPFPRSPAFDALHLWHVALEVVQGADGLGKSGFQLGGQNWGGGGSIEPPKTGGGGAREKGSIDKTINQSF